MPPRAAFAGAEFFGDREPDPRRDLLRTQEIFMRGLFEAAAFERHKPLITAHFAALVDGHSEMAAAEQLAWLDRAVGDRVRNPLGVEPRARADIAGRSKIDHQHAHRTVALRLQDE